MVLVKETVVACIAIAIIISQSTLSYHNSDLVLND